MRRILPVLLAALAACAVLAAEPPATAPAALAAARELYTARRDAEAQAAFERLLAADPANHEAVYHLGRLAKRRGDWPAVAKFYERCTVLAPANALYWADLGEAYGKLAGKAGIFEQLGLARKCRTALEKAIALAPDALDYRQGLVEFYEKAPGIAGGGRDKALAQATEIAKRDPYAGAMTTGGIQTRARQWAAAEAAFRAAAQARPTAPEPHVSLGDLFARRGDPARARAAYQEALRLAPQFKPAAEALAKLKP